MKAMLFKPHSKTFATSLGFGYLTAMTAIDALDAQPSKTKGNVDWILVIDTSASMVGEGGTKNIFAQVKQTVSDFVNKSQIGDSITIFTFDKDTTLRSNLNINSQSEQQSANQIIQQLQATGQNTHIGKALQDALNYSIKLESRHNNANRNTSIILFTDGIEDTTGITNPVSIPSNLALINNLNRKPFVFLVSLGEKVHESQLDQFANNPALNNRGLVLRSPGAANLLQAGNRIRQAARDAVPPPPKVIAQPQIAQTNIDFGQIIPGGETVPQILQVRNNVPAKIAIQLESDGSKDISLLEPNAPISVIPNTDNDLPIRLKISDNAIAGTRALKFTLIPEIDQPNIEPRNTTFAGNVTINSRLNLSNLVIDFDKVERGQLTQIRRITIQGNDKITIKPIVEPSYSNQVSLTENLRSLDLSPNSPVEFPVQLKLDDSLKSGSQKIKIMMIEGKSDQTLASLTAKVEVLDPLWFRLLPIILPLLIFLAMLGGVWYLLNRPNDLDGYLELEDHDQSIDLARLRTKKFDLAKELRNCLEPEIISDETKVELIAVKIEGKTQILIYPKSDNVEVNGLGVFNQEILYDGDVITIDGQVKATFHAIDHPRPNISESEDEQI
ncbi:vWA domain-containing protein [Pseudanabaena cinerea]|nr:vWA domain-containing protein [Pseudanabaena cinerea]